MCEDVEVLVRPLAVAAKRVDGGIALKKVIVSKCVVKAVQKEKQLVGRDLDSLAARAGLGKPRSGPGRCYLRLNRRRKKPKDRPKRSQPM